MPVPATKSELLDAIALTYRRLDADLARVPPRLAREASMPGHAAGTTISPADLVAYLIGWNEQVLIWLARDDRGEAADFPVPRLSLEPAWRAGAAFLCPSPGHRLARPADAAGGGQDPPHRQHHHPPRGRALRPKLVWQI